MKKSTNKSRVVAPPLPGKILMEKFMIPLALSGRMLAQALSVPQSRISQLLNGERSISPETALRLAKLFNMSPQFWLDLQTRYDLFEAEKALGASINQEVRSFDKSRLEFLGDRLDEIVQERSLSAKGRNQNNQVSLKKRLSKLSVEQKKIYDLVPSQDAIHFDQLFDKLGMFVGDLSAGLTMLELDDLIQRLPGDYYLRL